MNKKAEGFITERLNDMFPDSGDLCHEYRMENLSAKLRSAAGNRNTVEVENDI